MTLATLRSSLNQGSSLAVASAVFATGTGADIRIHTSASNLLPALATSEFFEVRDHSDSQNNGLYQVVTINTTLDDYECDKVNGLAPIVASVEAIVTLGATGTATEKSVFYDTAGLGYYLLEQGNIDADGATGSAIYSHMMQEWKEDNFLIDNAPFPVNAIDNDAGKYFIGQDSSGNSSGWNFVDVPAFSIRTRKLGRNMGWDEIDASGNTIARYFGCLTVDAVEDPSTDTPFGQFGTDTTVDDTFDLDFAGPANEAIQFFERLADDSINGGTGLVISADGRTLTRSDGGNPRTDGFIVGGRIAIRDAADSTADGTWLLSAVVDGIDGLMTVGRAADAAAGLVFVDGGGGVDQLTLPAGESWLAYGWYVGAKLVITSAEDGGNDGEHTIVAISTDGLTADVATGSFVANADDTTAIVGPFDDAATPDTAMNASIDNGNAFRLGLRVRDADPNGKTYSESNLVKISKSALGNFVFQFPLPNATDAKISETDANIDSMEPYLSMSMTFHSTPQARGGLVGGPYNFGIIVDGNNGTNIEVHEWIQRQLRKLTDIDDDADTAIGRSIGLLGRFNGDTYEAGSGDGGLTFPINPDGGGSGLFIDSLNAASDNATQFADNDGDFQSKPESLPITLDFNEIAIDDTATEYKLYFDRTRRLAVADFVLTSGGTPTITSAGSGLPNNAEISAGKYIRISGLTAGDAAMNGVYQITTETTPGDAWDVVRYDGAAIVSVASAAVDADQNCVNTPDGLVVNTNIEVAGTTISFVAPDQMLDSANGLGVYAVGDLIRIEGSTSGLNDSGPLREVATVVAGQVDFVEQDITTQGTGPTVTSTQVFAGFAVGDVTENFAFDGNIQGLRPVSTTTYVKAKAVGEFDAQYIESPVSEILSGVPRTIPLFAPQERNVI
jgi:hypothetical protein